MADKSIKQFPKTSAPSADDAVLIQRGNDYYYIEQSDLGFGVKRATLTLSSAQVKLLNTTPVSIATAEGAGTYLVPIRGYMNTNAGVAYATQTSVRLKFNGEAEANYLMLWTSILAQTTKQVKVGDINTLDNYFLQEDTDLEVFAPTADPTAGDYPITIVIYYEVRAI